jgi:hypothetical protein
MEDTWVLDLPTRAARSTLPTGSPAKRPNGLGEPGVHQLRLGDVSMTTCYRFLMAIRRPYRHKKPKENGGTTSTKPSK